MILKGAAGDVFMDGTRFRVLVAGRRFGKTRLVVAELASAAQKKKMARIWAVYPTYRQAKQIAWAVLRDEMPRGWIAKINETDLTIHLINGASISLRGADNPDSLRGVGLDFACFDEFDFIAPNVWPEVIRPMLTTTAGRALFVGTPDGFGPIYDMFKRGKTGKKTDSSWRSWQFTTLDGEWVPAQEIEDSKRDMDERTFRQEYLATFETATGRVYYAFDRAHNIMPAPEPVAAGPLLVGMDFNVNPMSAVIIAETELATYVVDEIVIKGRSNTEEMCAEIRTRYGARVTTAYPDPSGRHASTNAPVGRSDHDILRKAGFDVRCRGLSNVRDGINAVNSRLCSATGVRRLFVDPKCANLIAAFERHAYKDGTSIPDKSDEHGHILDALRYAVEYLHPIRERKEWAQ